MAFKASNGKDTLRECVSEAFSTVCYAMAYMWGVGKLCMA